jgi:hypothetical protein
VISAEFPTADRKDRVIGFARYDIAKPTPPDGFGALTLAGFPVYFRRDLCIVFNWYGTAPLANRGTIR